MRGKRKSKNEVPELLTLAQIAGSIFPREVVDGYYDSNDAAFGG